MRAIAILRAVTVYACMALLVYGISSGRPWDTGVAAFTLLCFVLSGIASHERRA